MLTIYGINSCDTCRRAKKYMDEKAIDYHFHDLRKDGVDTRMVERWAKRLSWDKLLNKRSLTWRKIPEVDRNDMNEVKAIASMTEKPTLIKRPVIESENFIAVGFEEERFSDIYSRIV